MNQRVFFSLYLVLHPSLYQSVCCFCSCVCDACCGRVLLLLLLCCSRSCCCCRCCCYCRLCAVARVVLKSVSLVAFRLYSHCWLLVLPVRQLQLLQRRLAVGEDPLMRHFVWALPVGLSCQYWHFYNSFLTLSFISEDATATHQPREGH